MADTHIVQVIHTSGEAAAIGFPQASFVEAEREQGKVRREFRLPPDVVTQVVAL
jgi:HSP20 family molecular chaperone IbpA